MNILQQQMELSKSGKPYALITVASQNGNSPYRMGKKMLLTEDGNAFGTIGGGNLELQIICDAIEAIKSGVSVLKEYKNIPSDNESLENGFETTIFIEIFNPLAHLVVCGGGSIGSAVLQLAKFVGFNTTLIDMRPLEELGEAGKFADNFYQTVDYEQAVLSVEIPENGFFLSSAPTHAMDKSALKGILKRSFSYIGILGDEKKKESIFISLIEEGISEDLLKLVKMPAGFKTTNSLPKEIALGIMAEMIMCKNGKNL